eukprot:TRINITY_DN61459_c0_g1_i1.p2 TRINITY_DN61459_c0_g1~~TRINITY_DN61459_c0_g1_i1.p2  ORF type:complete len:248 (+),score=93.65 TRINITY_DN61459_c0_g1_i1:81-746(+)
MPDTGAQVVEHAERGNWGHLIRVLEEHDLMGGGKSPAPPQCYACLMLAYMMDNELHSARFVHKRLSPAAQKDAQVVAAADVLRALLKRDTVAAHGHLASAAWQGACRPAAAALQDALRLRTAHMLSSAYSNLQVQRAARTMGCDKAEALAVAEKIGWPYDPQTGALGTPEIVERSVVASTTGLGALRSTCDHAIFLEHLGFCAQQAAEEVGASKGSAGGSK